MKRAIVHIRVSDMHALLGLSSTARITGFHVDPQRNGVTMRLEGAGLPESCQADDELRTCWRAPELIAPITKRTVLSFGEWE